MADAGAERRVREVIDNGKFTFENEEYVVVQNDKPSHETKTDFYIVAKKLSNEKVREFKISYKKPCFSFVENKVKEYRIPFIFGKKWSDILQDQTKSIQTKFNSETIIDFVKKTIKLGWRYEIEQLDAPGIGGRNLSVVIQQNISSQVLWGDGCDPKMRDALVDGKRIPNSGIPEFILIKNPNEIKTIQDVFDNLEDIKQYAKKHWKMRAGFIAQNNRLQEESNCWKTEGDSRSFAVWIKWDVINGNLRGKPVFDKPFEKTAGDVINNLRKCFEDIGIPYDSGFSFALLDGKITKDTIVRQ